MEVFFFVEGAQLFNGAVMDGLLPESVMDSIRRTAKSLKGYARRVFQAVLTKCKSVEPRAQRITGPTIWVGPSIHAT